jgi:hypothetical protein
MSRYKDLDFKLRLIESEGTIVDINVYEDLYDVGQSIKNIILTSPTERPFSVSGGGLYEFKYEKLSEVELLVLTQKLKASLQISEPRIIVNSINIIQKEPGKIEITVDFSPSWDPQTVKSKTVII